MNSWKVILNFTHVSQGTSEIILFLAHGNSSQNPLPFFYSTDLSLCILKSQVVFFTALLSNSYAISVKSSVFDFPPPLIFISVFPFCLCYRSHNSSLKNKKQKTTIRKWVKEKAKESRFLFWREYKARNT